MTPSPLNPKRKSPKQAVRIDWLSTKTIQPINPSPVEIKNIFLRLKLLTTKEITSKDKIKPANRVDLMRLTRKFCSQWNGPNSVRRDYIYFFPLYSSRSAVVWKVEQIYFSQLISSIPSEVQSKPGFKKRKDMLIIAKPINTQYANIKIKTHHWYFPLLPTF